jgi:hypothetical protein
MVGVAAGMVPLHLMSTAVASAARSGCTGAGLAAPETEPVQRGRLPTPADRGHSPLSMTSPRCAKHIYMHM